MMLLFSTRQWHIASELQKLLREVGRYRVCFDRVAWWHVRILGHIWCVAILSKHREKGYCANVTEYRCITIEWLEWFLLCCFGKLGTRPACKFMFISFIFFWTKPKINLARFLLKVFLIMSKKICWHILSVLYYLSRDVRRCWSIQGLRVISRMLFEMKIIFAPAFGRCRINAENPVAIMQPQLENLYDNNRNNCRNSKLTSNAGLSCLYDNPRIEREAKSRSLHIPWLLSSFLYHFRRGCVVFR